ncbi:membrane or exported protein [Mycobacterium tuberculosis]|nr:membrane or exported protein [Mycobacterium tuberculosis]
MNRRTLLWLSAIAALALVVAYQTLGSSAGRHADEFAARAGVPTVQPGADVLAGIAVLPKRIHRYDYRRSAFGHPWDDRNDAPGGHNGCDTRDDILDRDLVDKTYVSIKRCPNAVATGTLRDPYTNTTVAFQRGASVGQSVQIDHIVPLSYAWDMGAYRWAELRANALRQRSGQPAGRAGAGKSGQGRFATGPMDATQQGLRLSVRDAIHRRAARLFTASGSAIVRRTASGRGHLPDGLVHAPTVNLTT